MAQDYQEQIEQQGIQEYRSYIQEQMSQAREAADAELRSQHLANTLDGKRDAAGPGRGLRHRRAELKGDP